MRKLLLVLLALGLLAACDQETEETAPQGQNNQQIQQPKQQ
jgi:hypothetical protein